MSGVAHRERSAALPSRGGGSELAAAASIGREAHFPSTNAERPRRAMDGAEVLRAGRGGPRSSLGQRQGPELARAASWVRQGLGRWTGAAMCWLVCSSRQSGRTKPDCLSAACRCALFGCHAARRRAAPRRGLKHVAHASSAMGVHGPVDSDASRDEPSEIWTTRQSTRQPEPLHWVDEPRPPDQTVGGRRRRRRLHRAVRPGREHQRARECSAHQK
jgi:hypothetical protein